MDIFENIPAPIRESCEAELKARRELRLTDYFRERGRHYDDMISRGLSGTTVCSGKSYWILCDRWRSDLEDEVATWVPVFFKYAPQDLPDLKRRLLATDYAAEPEFTNLIERFEFEHFGLPKLHKEILKRFLEQREAIFDRHEKKCRADKYEKEQSREKEPVAPAPSGGYFACSELAVTYNVNQESLRKRLDRFRKSSDKGWRETADRKSTEARYVFQDTAVMHIISDLMVASGSVRQTSSSQNS